MEPKQKFEKLIYSSRQPELVKNYLLQPELERNQFQNPIEVVLTPRFQSPSFSHPLPQDLLPHPYFPLKITGAGAKSHFWSTGSRRWRFFAGAKFIISPEPGRGRFHFKDGGSLKIDTHQN